MSKWFGSQFISVGYTVSEHTTDGLCLPLRWCVFKSNLCHKYMQRASITSVHGICSSAKNRQASEITVMNRRKKKAKLWRHCDVCTKSNTIRQICVQAKKFDCGHIYGTSPHFRIEGVDLSRHYRRCTDVY